MSKGIIYKQKKDKDGWLRINLATLTMDILPALPFSIPPPPAPFPKLRASNPIPIREAFEENTLIDNLRALKGKISAEMYETIWYNYAKEEK